MESLDLMGIKDISPDALIFWHWQWVKINATIVFTWITMLLLTLGAWLATRRLQSGRKLSRWQNFLEVLVQTMRTQIRDIAHGDPAPFLPFVGSLFLFIALSNLLTIIPGWVPPTGSLSTTAALALCVLVGVPAYGIQSRGVKNYLGLYVKPSFIMLPMNILGELSRTLALAVRLFGNIMSGTKIAAILLAITPIIFPVVMQALGLLTGMIQAYIFAVLAMVYIASAVRIQKQYEQKAQEEALAKGDDNG